MTAAQEIDTILPNQDPPMELLRLTSSLHPSDEPRIASMLSGLVAARHEDEVICPLMMRRNLVIPAHQGSIARSAWRVD
ncbi:MAG TPA: hypothetical protein VHL98_08630 [Microvirga sp.]|jgi:hypothetical protein|nr:hypothetical protein [Microvirga sp.]